MELRKKIKTFVNEGLGVPDDIAMLVDIYTDMLLYGLKFVLKNEKPEEILFDNPIIGEYTAYKYKFKISPSESWNWLSNSEKFDLEKWKKFPLYRNKFDITLSVYPKSLFKTTNLKSPQISGSHNFKPEKFEIKNLKSKGEVYDISRFEFEIIISKSDLKKLDSVRSEIEAVVAHEILHSFQLYKKYKSVQKVGYGKETAVNFLQQTLTSNISKDWNDFMTRIYYSLKFEQHARLPQTYHELKNKKIKNYDDFIKEIKNTNIWSEIKFLKDFSPEKMIESLTKVESFEDLILRGPRSEEFHENIENWNDFLNIVRKNLINKNMDIDPFRNMSSNYLKDPKLFLNYWKKKFDKSADDMFRNIARLYDKVKVN